LCSNSFFNFLVNRWFLRLFQSLLTDEQVANAPIVVLGNKIDLPGAVSEQELRYVLGISSATNWQRHCTTCGHCRTTHGTIYVQCTETWRVRRSISMAFSISVDVSINVSFFFLSFSLSSMLYLPDLLYILALYLFFFFVLLGLIKIHNIINSWVQYEKANKQTRITFLIIWRKKNVFFLYKKREKK